MRSGKERRVRHDIGAKAKSSGEADLLRELVESPALRAKARALIEAIDGAGPRLEAEALTAVAHELVRRAVAARAR